MFYVHFFTNESSENSMVVTKVMTICKLDNKLKQYIEICSNCYITTNIKHIV